MNINPQAGWLTDVTAWLKRQIEELWKDFLEWTQDAFAWLLENVLDVFADIVLALPVPAFLQYGLGGLFAGLDPSVLYFVGLFRIPEGLMMLAAGVGFNLVRKLFTLGQW